MREVTGGALREQLAGTRSSALGEGGEAVEVVEAEDMDRWVLDFSPDCALIEVHRSGEDVALGSQHCVTRKGEVFPLSSPAWVKFQHMLDGSRSVSELVEAGSFSRSRIRRYVAEAVAQEILAMK